MLLCEVSVVVTQAKHVDSALGDEPFMLMAIKCAGVSPVVSMSAVPTEEVSRKFMAIVEGLEYKWPFSVRESGNPIEAHLLMSTDYMPVFPSGFDWDGATLALGARFVILVTLAKATDWWGTVVKEMGWSVSSCVLMMQRQNWKRLCPCACSSRSSVVRDCWIVGC